MTGIDDLDDELAAADVHTGFPESRRRLAGDLLGDGVTCDDVAMLAAHCRATVDGETAAARVLAALLGDARKRSDRLADLRRVADAKARRYPAARAFGDRQAEIVPPAARSDADVARIAAILWSEIALRLPDESARIAAIADVVGRPVETVRDLVAKGTEMRDGERVDRRKLAVDDSDGAPDRIRQFREQQRGRP